MGKGISSKERLHTDYKKCMWNLIENIKGKYVKGAQIQMLHYI